MTDDPLRRPDPADSLFETLWDELTEAARRGRHPWHTGVFATVRDGRPTARTVVLRHADRDTATLGLHTDRRAPKCVDLARRPDCGWLFYDATRRVQLRVDATATIHVEGDELEAAWAATGLSSRRCYLAPHAPGAPTDGSANLPEDLRDADPTADRSEAGKANFAVVRTVVERIEWLALAHDGHRRVEFTPDARGRWRGRPIAA